MKFKSKKTRLHNFHNKKFNINKNDSDINNSQFKDSKSKNTNNSSQNVFLKSKQKLIPEKLNPIIPREDYLLNQINNNKSSLSTKEFNIKNGLITPSNTSNSLQVKKSLNMNKINNKNTFCNHSFFYDCNIRIFYI